MIDPNNPRPPGISPAADILFCDLLKRMTLAEKRLDAIEALGPVDAEVEEVVLYGPNPLDNDIC